MRPSLSSDLDCSQVPLRVLTLVFFMFIPRFLLVCDSHLIVLVIVGVGTRNTCFSSGLFIYVIFDSGSPMSCPQTPLIAAPVHPDERPGAVCIETDDFFRIENPAARRIRAHDARKRQPRRVRPQPRRRDQRLWPWHGRALGGCAPQVPKLEHRHLCEPPQQP